MALVAATTALVGGAVGTSAAGAGVADSSSKKPLEGVKRELDVSRGAVEVVAEAGGGRGGGEAEDARVR